MSKVRWKMRAICYSSWSNWGHLCKNTTLGHISQSCIKLLNGSPFLRINPTFLDMTHRVPHNLAHACLYGSDSQAEGTKRLSSISLFNHRASGFSSQSRLASGSLGCPGFCLSWTSPLSLSHPEEGERKDGAHFLTSLPWQPQRGITTWQHLTQRKLGRVLAELQNTRAGQPLHSNPASLLSS